MIVPTRRTFAVGAVGGAVLLTLATLISQTLTPSGSGSNSYLETFDGQPSVPVPFSNADFDVQIHNRDSANSPMASLSAQHGTDCAGPPAVHTQPGGVFLCNDHVMTSLNEQGYGVIYLTPNRLVDFSKQATVSFDISTLRMSVRDWWDIQVSPYLEAQALPLLSDLSQGVDLQNPNRNSVVITIDNNEGAPNLKVVRNGAVTKYGSSLTPFNVGVTAPNPAATRQPFRLTLTATTVRFERLASPTGSGVVFVDQTIPALSWTQGVVQFGHHSYNPTKDGAGQPATWHWDNFAISSAVPFTIGHFSTRTTKGGAIVADLPAPPNAYLRFSAICKPVINGVSPPKMTYTGHPEHFSSYMMPIDAGLQTLRVSFTADDWYNSGFGCLMKDYTIWSLAAPIPAPTLPPTVAPTLPPASAPTPIPSRSPTASSTASPTVTPSASPAASPMTYSCTRSDGVPIWTADPGGRTCP